MFERYTQEARYAIFYGRYEASQTGSRWIEIEHLLLGILKQHPPWLEEMLQSLDKNEAMRQELLAHFPPPHESISTAVDLPLSREGKRALAYASEESERLNHPHICLEHLLLGILREDSSFAAGVLRENGIDLQRLRIVALQRSPQVQGKPGEPRRISVGYLRRIATELAEQFPGEPWVPLLADYLARCSPEDAERLAQAIRAAKPRPE